MIFVSHRGAHTNRLEPWWNFLNVSDSSHASSVRSFLHRYISSHTFVLRKNVIYMLQCQDVPSKLLKRRVQQQAQVLKFAFLSRGDGWKKTHIFITQACANYPCVINLEKTQLIQNWLAVVRKQASRFDATNCRKVSVEGSLRPAFDFTKQANQRRRHANVRNSE